MRTDRKVSNLAMLKVVRFYNLPNCWLIYSLLPEMQRAVWV